MTKKNKSLKITNIKYCGDYEKDFLPKRDISTCRLPIYISLGTSLGFNGQCVYIDVEYIKTGSNLLKYNPVFNDLGNQIGWINIDYIDKFYKKVLIV
jgi:hypothetical protein